MTQSSRPVLGVICCTRTVGTEPAQAVMHRYLAAASEFADAAILLAPSLPELASAAEIAPRLDGLLLTGSPSNIEPHRYGEPDAPDAEGPFDPRRDQMTQDLIRAMIDLGRPVFGICRGFQEINLAFGGTLRRDCAAHPGLLRHHTAPETAFDDMFGLEHPVRLTPGGRLAEAYGREALTVNSVHYQGVARLGDGLELEASAPDGLPEAVSARVGRAQVLAVQWHPEWKVKERPESQVFFRMLGEALRA